MRTLTVLANIEGWARALFPRARFQPGTGAWRVSSEDLGRDLEEDISITTRTESGVSGRRWRSPRLTS
jgi:hypothetical protein